MKVLRKGLWGLVLFAVVGFLWLQSAHQSDDLNDNNTFSPRFELTDHFKVVRTEKDFSGRWMLVFFGFTSCPDICPTTLSEISIVISDLDAKAEQVQPLFISIDPERDTPERLAEYVQLFDDTIISLTGSPAQLEKTTKSFYVYYEKMGNFDGSDDYSMGHSSQLFLLDPKGRYVKNWPYGTPASEITAYLQARIGK